MLAKTANLLPVRCIHGDCTAKAGSGLAPIVYVPKGTNICPSCENRGFLTTLAIIHLISPDHLGILTGFRQKYEFLCESSHKGYLELPKSPFQPRHYTGNPTAATCYECLTAFGATFDGCSLHLHKSVELEGVS